MNFYFFILFLIFFYDLKRFLRLFRPFYLWRHVWGKFFQLFSSVSHRLSPTRYGQHFFLILLEGELLLTFTAKGYLLLIFCRVDISLSTFLLFRNAFVILYIYFFLQVFLYNWRQYHFLMLLFVYSSLRLFDFYFCRREIRRENFPHQRKFLTFSALSINCIFSLYYFTSLSFYGGWWKAIIWIRRLNLWFVRWNNKKNYFTQINIRRNISFACFLSLWIVFFINLDYYLYCWQYHYVFTLLLFFFFLYVKLLFSKLSLDESLKL